MIRQMVHLEVNPKVALLDEVVDVKVKELFPGQKVTINLLLKEKEQNFWSNGHFIASKEGIVDLNGHVCHGGSYTGTIPMGLFCSLKAEGRQIVRLRKKNVLEPHSVKISVFKDHVLVSNKEVYDSKEVLSTTDIEWRYVTKKSIRVPIRDGRLRGTLFIPNDMKGKYPGVIDLYGSTGGLAEYRAALLSNHGFTVFALAYFGYDDLPKEMDFDLNYFEEAVDFLSQHPNVASGGIGTIGLSKGAEFALYSAVLRPNQVSAVVAIAPSHLLTIGQHSLNGITIQPLIMKSEHFGFCDERNAMIYLPAFLESIENAPEECYIPLEKASQTHFLFTHGTDDQLIDVTCPLLCCERLRKYGLENNFELHIYQGAGHLLEPGYMPFCQYSFHKNFGMNYLWGGKTVEQHSRAQADSWNKILAFLRNKLPKPVLRSESKL